MRILFLSSVLILFISGCDKVKDMININDQCEFKENILTSCFQNMADYEEILIESEEEYLLFQDSIRRSISNIDCDTASLEGIDFNHYTLLGKFTNGGGCNVYYNRNIFKDEVNEKIIYTIKVYYEGACLMYLMNWNWVLIPKVPNGYELEILAEEYFEGELVD